MSVETVEMRWPGENGWPYMKTKSDKKPVTDYTLSDSFAKDYLTSSTRKAAPVLRTRKRGRPVLLRQENVTHWHRRENGNESESEGAACSVCERASRGKTCV